MTKSALIKFRCTPQFKAALERESAYQRIDLSELIRGALDHYVREGNTLPPSLAGRVTQNEVAAPSSAIAIDRHDDPEAWVSGGHEKFEVEVQPWVERRGDGICLHGRPLRACWECA